MLFIETQYFYCVSILALMEIGDLGHREDDGCMEDYWKRHLINNLDVTFQILQRIVLFLYRGMHTPVPRSGRAASPNPSMEGYPDLD